MRNSLLCPIFLGTVGTLSTVETFDLGTVEILSRNNLALCKFSAVKIFIKINQNRDGNELSREEYLKFAEQIAKEYEHFSSSVNLEPSESKKDAESKSDTVIVRVLIRLVLVRRKLITFLKLIRALCRRFFPGQLVI